ncbi:putative ATP-dependent helicase [Dissostichus eleginoides]|uniref:ATP-dependent helicase n=1 Tax=Dissostichus eleginoides TaxID=100907 RepID=A0AAD9C5V0_DISEL|nr:putative ATP-dependent helicase [Dissostichus eleginoides]
MEKLNPLSYCRNTLGSTARCLHHSSSSTELRPPLCHFRKISEEKADPKISCDTKDTISKEYELMPAGRKDRSEPPHLLCTTVFLSGVSMITDKWRTQGVDDVKPALEIRSHLSGALDQSQRRAEAHQLLAALGELRWREIASLRQLIEVHLTHCCCGRSAWSFVIWFSASEMQSSSETGREGAAHLALIYDGSPEQSCRFSSVTSGWELYLLLIISQPPFSLHSFMSDQSPLTCTFRDVHNLECSSPGLSLREERRLLRDSGYTLENLVKNTFPQAGGW